MEKLTKTEIKVLDWVKTLPIDEIISNTKIVSDMRTTSIATVCNILRKHSIDYERLSTEGIILKSTYADKIYPKQTPKFIKGCINPNGTQNIYQIGTKSYEVYIWLQKANRNELITYAQLIRDLPNTKIQFIKSVVNREKVEFISTYGKGFTLMNKDNAVDIVENKMKKITSSINRAEECLENVKDIEVSKEDSKKIESYKINITYFQTYNNKIWGISNSAE